MKKKDAASNLLNAVTPHSFKHRITSPTRLTKYKGTLIDNFCCKISDIMLNNVSGILLNTFSDHQPYFINSNLRRRIIKPPKFITIAKYTADNTEHLKNELSNINITEALDISDTADHNKNYDKLN